MAGLERCTARTSRTFLRENVETSSAMCIEDNMQTSYSCRTMPCKCHHNACRCLVAGSCCTNAANPPSPSSPAMCFRLACAGRYLPWKLSLNLWTRSPSRQQLSQNGKRLQPAAAGHSAGAVHPDICIRRNCMQIASSRRHATRVVVLHPAEGERSADAGCRQVWCHCRGSGSRARSLEGAMECRLPGQCKSAQVRHMTQMHYKPSMDSLLTQVAAARYRRQQDKLDSAAVVPPASSLLLDSQRSDTNAILCRRHWRRCRMCSAARRYGWPICNMDPVRAIVRNALDCRRRGRRGMCFAALRLCWPLRPRCQLCRRTGWPSTWWRAYFLLQPLHTCAGEVLGGCIRLCSLDDPAWWLIRQCSQDDSPPHKMIVCPAH